MTQSIVDTRSPSEQPACTCTETHVRSRKLAFVRVDIPGDRIAAETIANGVRDVARALWVLHENLGRSFEAALITVLTERLECEVKALDALLDMKVMIEDTDPEEPTATDEQKPEPTVTDVLVQMKDLFLKMTALFEEQQQELRRLHGKREEEAPAA